MTQNSPEQSGNIEEFKISSNWLGSGQALDSGFFWWEKGLSSKPEFSLKEETASPSNRLDCTKL